MIQWLTTKASGRAHTHGADAGQTGWRLHAVEARDSEKLADIKGRRAVCGLLPKLGWGLDLFIEDKCHRCVMKAGTDKDKARAAYAKNMQREIRASIKGQLT